MRVVSHLAALSSRPAAPADPHPGAPARPPTCAPTGSTCGACASTPTATTASAPLCGDCYDYNQHAVWNTQASELWRRTQMTAKRLLDRYARDHGHVTRTRNAATGRLRWGKTPVRISFGKCAEFQRRGLVHFHILARFDGINPTTQKRSSDRLRGPTRSCWSGSSAKPSNTRRFRLTAWSSPTTTGTSSSTASEWEDSGYHRLRRWAHMLGFGGHFFTKSRRYSTTFRHLRKARVAYRRAHHERQEHLKENEHLETIAELVYAGTGWHTTGDALLANTAAALAREHRYIARLGIATTG
ncbi:replication initiator [Actinopolymorpha sp. B11F2]|uniref:replication initiator n=1 Tax=Actinopolymorpha sp. B11F2 TaxID=3160862 RepID=UPI0032E444D8